MIFKNQARGTEDKGKKEFVNVGYPIALEKRPFLHSAHNAVPWASMLEC